MGRRTSGSFILLLIFALLTGAGRPVSSVVRSLESGVGRPVRAGHPLAGARVGWVFRRRSSAKDRMSACCERPVARCRPDVRSLELLRQLLLLVLVLASSLARPLDVVALWLSSKYLIMHSTHVGGSSHVSHVESEGSERSEFTLCLMAYS